MWRGVRQQLLRLADLPSNSLAATLHELRSGQSTSCSSAMLPHASVSHVQVATKTSGATKTKYHPAIAQSRRLDYNQRLKAWRKELLAEVGATLAEEERQRKEKLAQFRADVEARYQAKLDRQRLTRLRIARERAEYEQAKFLYDTDITRLRMRKADLYAALHMQKKAWLLDHSQHWITKDKLDSRIGEALDNPVPLWNIPWNSSNTDNSSEALPPPTPQLSSWPLPPTAKPRR